MSFLFCFCFSGTVAKPTGNVFISSDYDDSAVDPWIKSVGRLDFSWNIIILRIRVFMLKKYFQQLKGNCFEIRSLPGCLFISIILVTF